MKEVMRMNNHRIVKKDPKLLHKLIGTILKMALLKYFMTMVIDTRGK